MFCSNCGGQLEAGASFCQHCGASVGATAGSEVGGGVTAPNPNLEKAKDISKNYFSFIKDHIKAPIRHAFSVHATQWINGLISLIIFVLFTGLSTFVMMKSVRGAFDIFGLTRKPTFFNHMLLPMFYMALTLAIIMAVIFVVIKLMKSEASYQDVIARFGTLMILPTAFIILSFLFSFLKLGVLISLMSAGYGLTWICSIALTVYSFSKKDSGGLDAYYGILITFLGLVIAMVLFGETLVKGLLPF